MGGSAGSSCTTLSISIWGVQGSILRQYSREYTGSFTGVKESTGNKESLSTKPERLSLSGRETWPGNEANMW